MNKKIIISLLLCISALMKAYSECELSDFDLAFTSGFVIKDDHFFKRVYGSGVIDVITADACYYPWTHGGIGLKTSYWERNGETTVLKERTKLHEVPLIAYMRGRFGTRVQGYFSLGGGVIFIHEKSYLGCVSTRSAVAEAEIGINWHIHSSVYLTVATNILFPAKKYYGCKIDVGGYGLRAGIGFSF